MKFLHVLILVCLLMVSVGGVVAQDEPTCDVAEIAASLAVLVDELAEADDPMAALLEIEEATIAARVDCGGLAFNSDDEGLMPVIGPVEIPEGLYRVTFTVNGMASVDIEAVEGACEVDGFMGLFFSMEMGGVEGAQAIFESDGCEALIMFSDVMLADEWTLDFEKLR
jgi:hypothetical protein